MTRIKARAFATLDGARMNEQPVFADRLSVTSLEAETQFAPNGIVSRTLFRSSGVRIVLFGFSEGQELSEHASTQHALVQMLSGEARWRLDGRERVLRAGELLSMPPLLPHAVKALTPFSMLLTLARVETARPAQTDEPGDCTATSTEKIFDVRAIPCTVKHGLILDRWHDLAVGDYFVLKNDHDPVPLRYQFEAEFPDAFVWEHLEKGPAVYQVRITKLAEPSNQGTAIAKSTCGCH